MINDTFTGDSYPYYGGEPRFEIVSSAIRSNDPDSAAAEVYDSLRRVPLDRLEESNDERANVRQVINLILTFVASYPTHSSAADLLQKCGELVTASASVLPTELETRYRSLAR